MEIRRDTEARTNQSNANTTEPQDLGKKDGTTKKNYGKAYWRERAQDGTYDMQKRKTGKRQREEGEQNP